MKSTLIAFLLLGFFYSESQVPPIHWQAIHGGTNDDYPHTIRQTIDGGYIVGGRTKSHDGDVCCNHDTLIHINNTHNTTDGWVVKLTVSGDIQWQRCLGGSNNEEIYAVELTNDGGYIAVGSSESMDGDLTNTNSGTDCWVVKLNSMGGIEWQRCYGGFQKDVGSAIQQTKDGGYIMAACANSSNNDVTFNHNTTGFWPDEWIVKLDSIGNIKWEKSFGGSKADYAIDIKQTPDNGYIVAGQTFSTDGDVTNNHDTLNQFGDAWIIKLDQTGNLKWEKCYGGSDDEGATSVQLTSDGGYVFAGYTFSVDGDPTGYPHLYLGVNFGDCWVVKLDSVGHIKHQKCLGGYAQDLTTTIALTSDGGYILGGSTSSNECDVSGNHCDTLQNIIDCSYDDAWVAKVDIYDSIEWQKCFGGRWTEEVSSLQQTADGGYVLTCYSNSSDGNVPANIGSVDIWVIKFDNPLIVEQLSNTNYITISPNPFSSTLSISLQKENLQQADFTITNIIGQPVYTQHESNLCSTYTKQIDLSYLPAGVYFLQVIANGERSVRQLVKQ